MTDDREELLGLSDDEEEDEDDDCDEEDEEGLGTRRRREASGREETMRSAPNKKVERGDVVKDKEPMAALRLTTPSAAMPKFVALARR